MKSIAIDGPSGSGKSTVAKALAGRLGFIYVDTGALYRALGLFAMREGIGFCDSSALASALRRVKIELAYIDGTQRIILSGEDVSEKIRTPEISMAASDVSALPVVREFLFELQQDMARRYNVVMDGRDIGTVVMPAADVKIFLTASLEVRATRRYEEYLAKGQSVCYNDILREMAQRDHNDITRDIAPLCQAPDAVLVDTSDNTPDQTAAEVFEIVASRLGIEPLNQEA